MSDGVILCLDLATRMGWACGVPGGTPRSGSVRLAPPGSDHGMIAAGFIKWLHDFNALEHPRAVFFEAPLNPFVMGGRSNFETVQVLLGLPFALRGVCSLLAIPRVEAAAISDIRKHFLGKQRLSGADAKRAVMAMCRNEGWEPADDNAADALALFSYASAQLKPKTALRVTPLFSQEGRT